VLGRQNAEVVPLLPLSGVFLPLVLAFERQRADVSRARATLQAGHAGWNCDRFTNRIVRGSKRDASCDVSPASSWPTFVSFDVALAHSRQF